MKGARIVQLFAIALVLLPAASIMSNEVRAGAPIFQASIEMLTESFSLNLQEPMDIEVDGSGRIYVLYQSDHTFFWGVYLVHSDDDGLTWSQPKRVDDVLLDGNTSNDEAHAKRPLPSMAVANDGTVYVVWGDWRFWNEEPTLSYPAEIRIAHSADGENFSASRKVDPPKAVRSWDATQPDIAINRSGRLFCVWMDKMDAGAYNNIWSSYSDDGGFIWSAPIMINTDGKDYRDHDFPRCAMNDDDVYVTWQDERNDTYGVMPYLASSHDAGATFVPEIVVTDDIEKGNERTRAYPAVDTSGALYIAWNDMRSQRGEVYFSRSTDGGSTLSANMRAVTPPEGMEDAEPHLDTLGAGRIMLTFQRTVHYEQTRETDVYFIESTDGGQTWVGMLRVDDTDRFGDDRTDQEKVLGTYNNDGRALCVWSDGRKLPPGAIYRDLFFTRGSKTLTGGNMLPVLISPDYTGESVFDPFIGNTSTSFNFTVMYLDGDNDAPGIGFPRLQVFSDAAGSSPVYGDGLVMSRTKGERDVYFMDGVEYFVEANMTGPGRFYWRIQTTDGVAPDLISSGIRVGPLIDTTLPTLAMLGPEPAVWMSEDTVECRVRVEDTGGAGVDPATIRVQRSIRGTDYFERGLPITGYQRIDNDTFEAWAMVKFVAGTDNYVRFEAKDRVQNGPSISDMFNLWVDPDAPFFSEARPTPKEVQIYPLVNCSVIVRDTNQGTTMTPHTGLDPTTIRYAYKTTTEGFSDWMEPAGYSYVDEDAIRAHAFVEYPDEGVYSFIKWSATDKIGNTAESEPFRINVNVPVNYRPVFVGSVYPDVSASLTPHIWWDPAYDEEDDPLYYKVMILSYPGELQLTPWMSGGENRFLEVDEEDPLSPGYYLIRVNVTDMLGGYDVMDHILRISDTGVLPPTAVPAFGPYYSSSPNITVEWEHSTPGAPAEISYEVRVGRSRLTGDVMDWMPLRNVTSFDLSPLKLPWGAYSFQVIAFANGNYSRVTEGLVKISDYSVRMNTPANYSVYRGKGVVRSKPLTLGLLNYGTLEDNVTVYLEGELVDLGWATQNLSGEPSATYLVPSSKGLSQGVPVKFTVLVVSPDNAPRRDYVLRIRAVSEDGVNLYVSDDIIVKISEAPSDDTGGQFTDDLADLVTDVFPFLGGLPSILIVLIFLFVLMLIIMVPVALVIFVYKRRAEKRRKADPFVERRKLFIDIYGRAPTAEEEGMWKDASPSVEEMVKKGAPPQPEGGKSAPVAPGLEAPKGAPEKGKGPDRAPAQDATPQMKKEDKELLDRLFDER